MTISQAELKANLKYDKRTGVFTWKVQRGRANAGDVAGGVTHGYVVIAICGTRYMAHRLAWLYETGNFPVNQIDHKNGIRNDNRFKNLRDVDVVTNAQNIGSTKRSMRSTGLLGAYVFKPRDCFVSYIRAGGKKINLGYFKSAQEAHRAYLRAKTDLHPGFVPSRVA